MLYWNIDLKEGVMNDPFKHVPQEVWEALSYDVAREELEYADSYRAMPAYQATKDEVRAYQKAVTCCGQYEGTVIVDGRKWIYGCNYGH